VYVFTIEHYIEHDLHVYDTYWVLIIKLFSFVFSGLIPNHYKLANQG